MEEQIYKDADGELYAVKPSDIADAEAAGMVLANDAERKSFFDKDAALKAERQQTAVAAGLAPEQVDVSVPSMEDLGLVREAAKSSGANVKRMIEGPVISQGKPPEKPQPILDPDDIEAFRNRVHNNAQGFGNQAMTALESYLDGVFYDFPTWAEGALADHLTDGDWKNYFSPQSIQMRKEENKATDKAAGIAGIITPSIGTVAKIVKPELLEKAIIGPALKGAAAVDVGGRISTKATARFLGKGIEKEGVQVLGTTLPKLEADVAQSRIVERMAFYGAKPGIIEGLKTKTGQVVIQGAVAGAEQGVRKAFQEGSRVSREATGESMGSAMINGAISGFKEGAVVGGGIAAAAPLGIAGVRGTINLVNATLQKINEKVTPIIGSILTKGLTPIEITRTIEESRKLAGREIQSEVPTLIKSLDQEYNTWTYMREGTSLQLDNYLKKIKNVPPERKAFIEGWKQVIEDTNKTLQKNWMTKTKQGDWVFDPDKLKKYLSNPDIEDGQIQLPVEIRAYREFINTLLETTDQAQKQMYEELGVAPIASARKLLETAAEGDVALIPGVPQSENVLADILRTQAMEQNLGRQMGVLEAGRRTKFGLGEIFGGSAAGSITSIALNQLGVPPEISATILGGGLLGTPLATTMFDPSATIKIMRTVDEVAIKANEALASTSSKLVFGKTPQTLTRGFMAGSLKLAEQDRRSDNLTATYDRYAKEAGRINDMANNIDKLSEELDRGTAGLEDFPELSEISKNSMANGIKFLQSKLPKQNGQVLTLKDWKPTKRQIDEYLRYSDYVQDPTTMLLDMQEKNYVPDQALEVMRAVYPSLLKEFQISLYQQLADAKESGTQITQQNRQMIDKVLGLSSEGLTPEQIKKNQDALNAPPTPKAGGKVGGGAQLEATPTQERELRKR